MPKTSPIVEKRKGSRDLAHKITWRADSDLLLGIEEVRAQLQQANIHLDVEVTQAQVVRHLVRLGLELFRQNARQDRGPAGA